MAEKEVAAVRTRWNDEERDQEYHEERSSRTRTTL